MGFIPADARWYLAEIVLEHEIQDDPRNVVHINLHLIEADSPVMAYDKACALGREEETGYLNTDGKLVRVTFRGLRDLNVLHDGIEDGAEIIFEESVGVPEATLREWVTERDRLGVFAPISPREGIPNYLPGQIWQLLRDAPNRCDGTSGVENGG